MTTSRSTSYRTKPIAYNKPTYKNTKYKEPQKGRVGFAAAQGDGKPKKQAGNASAKKPQTQAPSKQAQGKKSGSSKQAQSKRATPNGKTGSAPANRPANRQAGSPDDDSGTIIHEDRGQRR